MGYDFDSSGGSGYMPLQNVDSFVSDLERQNNPQPQQQQPKEYRQVSDPELDTYLKDIEKGITEADIQSAQGIIDGSAEKAESRPSPRIRVQPKTRYNLVGRGRGKSEPVPGHTGETIKVENAPKWDALSVGPKPKTRPKRTKPMIKLKRL
jgi:hypothetical protein